MELRTFIKNALLDIVGGVEDANSENNRFQLSGHKHYSKNQDGQKVEFDLSIMVNEASETDVNGGIKVALFNLGAGEKKSESNHNTHKLKFEVFISEK